MNVPRWDDWAPALAAGDHAEVFLEEGRSLSLTHEEGRLSEAAESSDAGVGVRYLRVDRGRAETRFGSQSGLDPAAGRALAARLAAGLPRRPVPAAPRPEVSRHTPRVPPASVPLAEKAALLAAVDKALRAEFPRLTQVQLTCAERERSAAVLDSAGSHRLSERVTTVFYASVTAEQGRLLQTGVEVLGGLKGWEALEGGAALAAGRRAARLAVAKLEAPVARPGDFPVVLAASAGGTFVHEAIGHSLEADHVQEGTSPAFAGKMGRRVACGALTIVDDPTLPFARGSYAFDDEGVPAAAVTLVERGVLRGMLHDRVSALRAKAAPNGHGRRQSFRARPIPRMSNIYIAPGPDDPARIVRELKKGLYVTRMGGGEVNTATGEFVFGVDEGWWVEDGVVRHMVRDANILGVGSEVLKSIDRVGWDIGWSVGTCGKQGQGVPVSDGQPTLRIPKLLVGGRA
ncbi:TldD/PmbA family protein [bacterium]|nr:MAG: TldD/PmbA family protein [bacterium]